MSSWFKETPESLRLLAEERALIEATELIADALANRDVKRVTLAARLGISRSEITQRLNGKRNLTVKTLAAMLHELGYRIRIDAEDLATGTHHTSRPMTINVTAPKSGECAPRYTNTGTRLQLVRQPVAAA